MSLEMEILGAMLYRDDLMFSLLRRYHNVEISCLLLGIRWDITANTEVTFV